MKRLRKGKKSTFSLFGSSNTAKDDEGRDEERIRMQMILDVEAFGKDGESLGVGVEQSESFKLLKDMVYALEGKRSHLHAPSITELTPCIAPDTS